MQEVSIAPPCPSPLSSEPFAPAVRAFLSVRALFNKVQKKPSQRWCFLLLAPTAGLHSYAVRPLGHLGSLWSLPLPSLAKMFPRTCRQKQPEQRLFLLSVPLGSSPLLQSAKKTPSQRWCFLLLAPTAGLEPATNRLTADCSTTELSRNDGGRYRN